MNYKTYLNQSQKECVFCNPSTELILDSTPNFVLMFDPFPLVPGHLLITSKEHYGCLGEVPEHLQKECAELRDRACQMLTKAFNKNIFRYEHGRAGHCLANGISSRSCHHYHEHLLPAELSLSSVMEARFKGITLGDLNDICRLFNKYDEYLLVEEPGIGARFYIAQSYDVEPHLLRTLVSEALNFPERANWETYSSCELLLKGMEMIQKTNNRSCVA